MVHVLLTTMTCMPGSRRHTRLSPMKPRHFSYDDMVAGLTDPIIQTRQCIHFKCSLKPTLTWVACKLQYLAPSGGVASMRQPTLLQSLAPFAQRNAQSHQWLGAPGPCAIMKCPCDTCMIPVNPCQHTPQHVAQALGWRHQLPTPDI